MTVVKKSRSVAYTCEQMYHLVNDVERYADFLPYFSSGVVHYKDADEAQATLSITAAGISKSFTTCNRLQVNKMIEMRLIDGPFSHLEGFWRFDETPKGCHITFDLEFEWSGKLLSMMLEPVVEEVAHQIMDAFCKRAAEIYDQRHRIV